MECLLSLGSALGDVLEEESTDGGLGEVGVIVWLEHDREDVVGEHGVELGDNTCVNHGPLGVEDLEAGVR